MKLFDKFLIIANVLGILLLFIAAGASIFYAIVGNWPCFYRTMLVAIFLKLSWVHEDVNCLSEDDSKVSSFDPDDL